MEEKIKSLNKALNEQVEWRISEITSLKTIPYMNNISDYNREILMRYSVPAFYALWEGYVVVSIQEYLNMINSLDLSYDEIHPKLIAHDIDMKHDLKNGRVNLKPRVDFCLEMRLYFSKNVNISTKVPTKSNVSFKTVNHILDSLNLEILSKQKYEYPLKQLIKYRNDIAHGENSLKVDDEIIFRLSSTIISCMDAFTDSIMDGVLKESYRV